MRVLLAACAMLVLGAATAAAQGSGTLPDPSKTTISRTYVEVEGWTACATGRCPDACSDNQCGRVVVTVRDFANNVLAGATVRFDFNACSDIALSCDQLTAETGQVLVAPGLIDVVTDVHGQATFQVQGHGTVTMPPTGTAPGPEANTPCVAVSYRLPEGGDFIAIASLYAAVYDLNGAGSPAGAVNGADVAIVSQEMVRVALGATARARDDYNHSRTMNGADVAAIAKMVTQAALGTGSQNTTAICP
jgi:hypothetical protein